MGAAVFALTAFEIAIGSAGAAFVRLQNVVVHADAHAASGIAPLESGGDKNFVEAFGFRLRFHAARTGNDERLLQRFRNVLSSDEFCGKAQIFESRIGARTDEDAVE